MRMVGTTARGLRAPIIHEGQNLVKIVVNCVVESAKSEGYEIKDRDIIAVTESILARAQGNYASIDDIAEDIKQKFESDTIGVVFPIMSRNRFQQNLKAIARSMKKVVIQIEYPADEVGNQLVPIDEIEDSGINPWSDVYTEAEFREIFPVIKHLYTGYDYIKLYRDTVEAEGAECEIILSNRAETILDYTQHVLVSNIHDRKRTFNRIKKAGAKQVLSLQDILNNPITEDGGYNDEFGLLGANYASDERVKLFPRHSQEFVIELQKALQEVTGKHIEAMVYGDGAYKDPFGGIWEMADPVVSPGYTEGLGGTPNEVKIKMIADKDFEDLSGEELTNEITGLLKTRNEKRDSSEEDDSNEDHSLGTTPRRIPDLLGSFADLTSGSGDKGTPFVYIQGYFDNYADQ
ncbi:MAG: coenzyme F420-0:L-glutamate ligase [Atopococcus tabaci]|uniref:Coenzyme F420-0:L-glutamate ligase n=1 Tax=Atopococcus tabaci TaxID=269774 RepID=A0AA43UBZ5_9LACT|nr:coenzyme F420-0:L-glutamate ligase [Atopococcus tabaci]